MMPIKKSILSSLLILATVGLVACGNQQGKQTHQSNNKTSQTKHQHKKSKKQTENKRKQAKSLSQSNSNDKQSSVANAKVNAQASSAESGSQLATNSEQPMAQSNQNTQVDAPSSGSPATSTGHNASSAPSPQPGPQPGPVDSKVLGVPYISQGSTMLCEGTSLLEALHYKGVTNISLNQFVSSMPISPDNNPYNGFSGNWQQEVDGTYQGMMAGPVIQWAAKVGGRATQIAGPAAIKNSIRNGNPVVAWIVYGFAAPQFKQMPWGRAVWNGHVVCVDGFNPNSYHIVDPDGGTYWVTNSAFEGSNGVTGMAVSVG